MEQNLAVFLLSAVLISLSGVLSPGPMTAAAIQQGGKSASTGMYIAFGHGVIEMPLIFIIFLGAGSLFKMYMVRLMIGLAGGVYLIYIGRNLLRFKGNMKETNNHKAPSSFYSGILLSAGNPYFLLWWATVGAGLVISASKFGSIGLILFAIFHWLCDFAWYTFLSLASFKGIKMFGEGLYKKVTAFCGLAMLFYGSVFIFNSLKLLM